MLGSLLRSVFYGDGAMLRFLHVCNGVVPVSFALSHAQGEKRSLSARDASDRELLAKGSMSVALLPESEEDRKQAKAVAFKHQRPCTSIYYMPPRL